MAVGWGDRDGGWLGGEVEVCVDLFVGRFFGCDDIDGSSESNFNFDFSIVTIFGQYT